jgi:DNA-binding GntR family transcriptional regulator
VLAAERASEPELAGLRRHVETMREVGDFSVYRQADVFFHIGVAEASRSTRLLSAMTEVQAQMGELLAHIAHPAPVLSISNAQHEELLRLFAKRDRTAVAACVREHLLGTERILSGLLP